MLFVLTLALALRLYRLGDESMDLEEYVTFIGIDAPNVFSYIHRVHMEYRTMAPLSFGLQYLWMQVFGVSAVAARALTVTWGMLTVLGVYLFARRFYGGTPGRHAGFLAALLAAISPVHVFYSQEARQYPLLALLVVVSFYALLRALREDRRGWYLLNAAVNFRVLFTHPFAVLVLLTQGLVLLAFRWRQWRRVFTWGLAHALMLIPLVLWVRDMPKSSEAVFSTTEESSLGEIAWDTGIDLLADDVVHMGAQLGPAPRTFGILPEGVAEKLREGHIVFDVLLVASLGAVAVWLLGQWWRAHPSAVCNTAASEPSFEDYGLLLAWFAVPPLAIGAISWLLTPCNMTRYTIYASLALYIAAGGALAARRAALRAALTVFLATLYAFQLWLTIPGPIRAEWRPAAEYVSAHGAPQDPVFIHGPMMLPIWQLNAPDAPHPLVSTLSREALCEVIVFYFKTCAPLIPTDVAPSGGWGALFQGQGPGTKFEQCLHSAGCVVRGPTIFRGSRQILLYRVEPPETLQPPPEISAATRGLYAFFMDMFRTHESHAETALFERSIMYEPDAEGAPYVKLGAMLARRGWADAGVAALAQAFAMNPAWYTGLIELYVSIMRADEGDVVIAALQRAVQRHPSDAYARLLLGAVHNNRGEYAQAASVLESAIARAPEDPWIRLSYWRAVATLEDYRQQGAMEEAFARDATMGKHLGALYKALYEQHEPSAALDALEEWRAAGFNIAPELGPILKRRLTGE